MIVYEIRKQNLKSRLETFSFDEMHKILTFMKV